MSKNNNVSELVDTNAEFFTQHSEQFLQQAQFLHLRHAESHGNRVYKETVERSLPAHVFEEMKLDPVYVDTKLSKHGEKQAAAAQPYLNQFTFADNKVYVSPFRRCISTAFLALQSHPQRHQLTFVFTWLCKEIFYTSGNVPLRLDEFESYCIELATTFGFGQFDLSSIKQLGLAWSVKTSGMGSQESKKQDLIAKIEAGEDHVKLLIDYLIRRVEQKVPGATFFETPASLLKRIDEFKDVLAGLLDEQTKRRTQIDSKTKILVVSHSFYMNAFSAEHYDTTTGLAVGKQFNFANAQVSPFCYAPELAKIQKQKNPFFFEGKDMIPRSKL